MVNKELPALVIVVDVPAPCTVIPLLTVTPPDHVQLPAGTVTVSPLAAEFTADCTEAWEQFEALTVAALAFELSINKKAGRANVRTTLNTLCISLPPLGPSHVNIIPNFFH
jgi:hypothetical protein